jgi:hypothetical protein
MFKIYIKLLFFIFIISSCSINKEGGISLGRKGSPAWIQTSSQKEINEYFASKPIYELCMIWDEKYDWIVVRKEIAKSLELRGEDPLKCNNPQADSERRRNDAAEKVRASKNNQLQRDRMKARDIEDSLRDMEDKLKAVCRASGKILIGKQCI